MQLKPGNGWKKIISGVKTMIYFIDTNIFVRLIMREDKQITKECDDFFEQVKFGKLEAVTSTLVLAEVGWLLKSYYRLPKLKVVQSLKGIGSLGGLKIEGESSWFDAINLYGKYNVKLTDAMIAAIPQIADKEWTIVSYDEDFKKLPVKWKKPGDGLY